jgi:hypothetical protein
MSVMRKVTVPVGRSFLFIGISFAKSDRADCAISPG